MSSFIHSAAWKRFQERLGNRTEMSDGQLFIHKRVSFADYWICSRCVIKPDTAFPEPAGAHFLRLEPLDTASLTALQGMSAKLEPTIAVQPRQTMVLDLTKSEEELLAAMKQKHRYNLKKAQGNDLKCEMVSTNTVQAFPRFWKLLSDTAGRQEFRTQTKSYYETMLAELEKDGMAHIAMVSKSGKDLAGMILVTDGETATYLHGASSDDKELRAPFLLHWEMIKFAKALGCKTYDFWGTDLVFNTEEGEWQAQEGKASTGTSRFKLGFGGTVIDYPGTYDLILKPFWYTLYKLLRRIRGGKRAFA